MIVEVLPGAHVAEISAVAARHRYVDVRLRPRELVVGGAIAYDGEAWNHALVPENRLHQLDGMATILDLPLRRV